MPASLDTYLDFVTEADRSEHTQIRVLPDETLSARGLGGRVGGLFPGGNSAENQRAHQDFQACLGLNFSAAAVTHALAASGLDDRANDQRPLTARRVKEAVESARNFELGPRNLAYQTQYAGREQAAQNWTPHTAASGVTEAQSSGLRLHANETADMRVQSWHLANNDLKGQPAPRGSAPERHELDEAVRREMAALQVAGGTGNPRLDNLQARLNLLEKMVTQAETYNNANANPALTQVFTAPEWLFTSMDDVTAGEAVSGGALTEEEMKKVTAEVVQMSGRHPNMLIMPGTILWSKPAQEMLTLDHKDTPADMLFNVAPVVADGQLVHMGYKMNDGTDVKMGCKGGAQAKPYDVADQTKGWDARVQIFMKDGMGPQAASAQQLRDLMKEQLNHNAPERAWEQGLRNGAQPQVANHYFQALGKTFAMDICADHGDCAAIKELEKVNRENLANPLITQIIQAGGADAHLVIAAGAAPRGPACAARQDGLYALNDMTTGNMVVAPVNNNVTFGGDGMVQGRRVGAGWIRGELASNQNPPVVANHLAPPVAHHGHGAAVGVGVP
ncbi:MAG: hypothetical protein V4662_22960 [Verrucomicrobiota bacterium]